VRFFVYEKIGVSHRLVARFVGEMDATDFAESRVKIFDGCQVWKGKPGKDRSRLVAISTRQNSPLMLQTPQLKKEAA
jgi:hypothetical protein